MRSALAAVAIALCGCAPRQSVATYPPSAGASGGATADSTSNAAATSTGTATSTSTASSVQVGEASWYGDALAGHRTASGERFNPSAMTAAHRTLPFNTWVEVTRLDTGKTVRVRITDRGPFGRHKRVIDLSKGAAAKLDMIRAGVAEVQLRVVGGPE